MVISVREALCADTAEIITVIREPEQQRIDGRVVVGTPTEFKTLASVQFPTGKQIQDLPEGERTKESIVVISVKPIRSSVDQDGLPADKVRFKGKIYKIIVCKPWDSYGYTYSMGVRDRCD